jgi:GrpB-like predicted nucleotidyltransferase (UPF0157 family)
VLDEAIEVVPYDGRWPQLAAEESARLRSKLGPHVPIEHFGSTSVPGCDAKPIIDLLVGVSVWPAPAAVRTALTQLGYEDLGEAGIPGRLYFRRRGVPAFNLAVALPQGELWQTNLRIRELLRKDPELMRQYAQQKRAAVRAGCTTLIAYSNHKASFMSELVRRAGQA